MINKRALMSMIDKLPPDDLEEVYQHIRQHRQVVLFHKATGTHQVVPEAPEPAENIKQEVNNIVNEALELVRRKRETQELQKTP